MDPAVILPAHIFEDILSYIGTREIKNVSFVSKLWHELISSSCSLQKDIVYSIRNDWIDDEKDIATIVECSKKRNFHSILLADCSDMYEQVFEIVSAPMCSISTVSIFDMKFESSDACGRFFTTFADTVRNLTLRNVKITNDSGNCIALKMDSLQSLRISNCDSQLCRALLQHAPKLTSLELGFGVEFDARHAELLRDCAALRKLSINKKLLCSLLADENFINVKFQLVNLAITFSDFEHPSEALKSIQDFLESQQSLEKLDLADWLGFDILECALRMKKLKELSLFTIPTAPWSIGEFPPSNSIEILDVRTFYFEDNDEDMRKLLSAVPNVTHLKLRSMTDEIAQFIESRLKKVATISLIHPSLKQRLPHVSFD